MIKKIKQKFIAVFMMTVVTVLIFTSTNTFAYVNTSDGETTDVRAISVTGATDSYPYEYYNSATGEYEGVFPDILKLISEKSGIDFVYVYAGKEPQLYRAKDGSAELVTAFFYDEKTISEYDLDYGADLVTYDKDGTKIRVGFAFTSNVTATLKTKFLNALDEITDEEILEVIASYDMVEVKDYGFFWWIFAIVVAVCLIFAALYLMVRRKKEAAEAKRKSVIDELTGVGNKEYFSRKFDEASVNNSTALYALAFIGFDIVHVNGFYGEDAAEEQMRFAAKELKKNAQSSTDIIARVAGGGFAFMHVCQTSNYVTAWIDSLIKDLNWYMKNYDKGYKPYFHAGVFYMQPGYRDRKQALANAQRVYQYAVEKELPFYIANAKESVNELIRNQLKRRISSALEADEFKQFFQPVIDMESSEIVGVEALSRWYHPDMGILNPAKFVELMEEEGTIMELDLLILEKACAILEKWHKEGCEYYISTNFTRSTISSPKLRTRIWDIIKKYNFIRSKLTFEITEDCLEQNKETAFANVAAIKNMGFKIALDDVGNGYTFFSDFINYPIDEIKVDREVLLEAEKSTTGRKLFEGIVYMCKNLGFEVLVEGVETANQYELVKEIGCDKIQGYYFYRAMPESDFDKIRRKKG